MIVLKLFSVFYLFFIDTGQAVNVAESRQHDVNLLRKGYNTFYNLREEKRNINPSKSSKTVLTFVFVNRNPKSKEEEEEIRLLKLQRILKSEKSRRQKQSEIYSKEDIYINNEKIKSIFDILNSTNTMSYKQKDILRKRSSCDKKASKFCIRACERATNNSCKNSFKCSKKKKRTFKKQCQVMCKGHFLYNRDSNSDSDDDASDCD